MSSRVSLSPRSPAGTDNPILETAGPLWTATNRLGVFLVTLLCVSGLQFCLYIAFAYIAPMVGGNLEQWNVSFLPGLHTADNPGATSSIGVHFVAGALVMVLGCVQMWAWCARGGRECIDGSGGST